MVFAIGALRPARTSTSNTASSAAESDDPPGMMGLISSAIDRKSTRLTPVTFRNLVCRLLLEKTKVNLVPTMSHHTSHLVMLQRSPTYIASLPQEDPTAQVLRIFLPISWAFLFNDTATAVIYTNLYTLSLRDALPI